jgi:hypothetical protein
VKRNTGMSPFFFFILLLSLESYDHHHHHHRILSILMLLYRMPPGTITVFQNSSGTSMPPSHVHVDVHTYLKETSRKEKGDEGGSSSDASTVSADSGTSTDTVGQKHVVVGD